VIKKQTSSPLNSIRIVLVRTFHAGNIGAAARSMKTMGLTDLWLVKPRDYPSADADKMAAGAQDMLNNITVVDSLSRAVSDCTVVIASSVRPRNYDLPTLSPDRMARMLVEAAVNSPVALIFGPERMGLHNDDLQYAKYRVSIPSNPNYNSLNLAAAVQILAYEVFKASSTVIRPVAQVRDLPSADDIERLYVHLEQVLKDIHFLRPHQGQTMQRLRHLTNRAEPDVLETNIIRGILTAIEKSLNLR